MRWDSALLVVAPLGGYGLLLVLRRQPAMRNRIFDLGALCAPIGIAASVNLAYDFVRFREALGGAYKADPFGYSTPLLKGLFGLWLSPGVGLFVYTPVLLMSLVAFRWFWQRWPAEAILILVLFLLRSVFYGRYWAWEGGATWGPRYLVPLIPLLLLPLAFLPRDRWLEIGAVALGVIGLLIQLLGQLVPYGLYYGTVVPQLMAQLGYCQHCLPFPGVQSQAVNAVTDFDLRYVPLMVQVRYLVAGVMAPAWGPIALALPMVAAGMAAVGVRMRRMATQLDLKAA